MKTNALYYGDCLDWMEKWQPNSVDLIYLDPPFKSNRDYNQIFHSDDVDVGDSQYRVFEDIWRWDSAAEERLEKMKNYTHNSCDVMRGMEKIVPRTEVLSYLTYMAERLEQCHRLLKDSGSIYLHCDPSASHYLKVLMDAIFAGRGGFRNEIVWCYAGGGVPKKDYPRKHDIILRYSKGNNYTFNVERKAYGEHAKTGRRATDLGGTRSVEYHPDGTPVNDWWVDIKPIINWSKERLDYPTQKPEALLDRIIRASSNEGDIVLDPFCGCGTTIEVARKLNRRFVGIDISSFAIDVVRKVRMPDEKIHVDGLPKDLVSARRLAKDSPYNFEAWAIQRIPGMVPNNRRGADRGVDGRGSVANRPDGDGSPSRLVLAQVKGGRKFSLSHLRDFMHVIDRDKAAMGIFITIDKVTSHAAKTAAAEAGRVIIDGNTFPRMQLWSIEEYFGEPRRLPWLPTMRDPYKKGNKPIARGLFDDL